jgi:hypothetical protein
MSVIVVKSGIIRVWCVEGIIRNTSEREKDERKKREGRWVSVLSGKQLQHCIGVYFI